MTVTGIVLMGLMMAITIGAGVNARKNGKDEHNELILIGVLGEIITAVTLIGYLCHI